MWVFTKYGFYSVVCARQGDGRHGQPVDFSRLMVRARLRGHLDALKARFPELIGECEIQEFAGSDYACRIFVEKARWSRLMALLADDIDYDNFKSEVARHEGARGAAYEHALHDVWSVMYRLQRL
jgi:hypothetical protein